MCGTGYDGPALTVENVQRAWKNRPKNSCRNSDRYGECMWLMEHQEDDMSLYWCELFEHVVGDPLKEQPCCDYDFTKKIIEII